MGVYSDQQILDALTTVEHAGGEQYANKLHPSDADVVVSTRGEFRDALSGSYNSVGIEPGASISLSDGGYDIGSKTIIGDRGWNGSPGPLLYTTTNGYDSSSPMGSSRPHTVLYSNGNPRITGIRLRGADYDRSTNFYPPDSQGGDYRSELATGYKNLRGSVEIDNCEIYGFAWCQIVLRGGNGHIHHNHIHTAPKMGYGYGVNLWETYSPTYVDFHHNYSNYCRHVVNGRGPWDLSYDAYQNIIGPNHANHIFDMHCLAENGLDRSSTRSDRWYGLRAGGRMNIFENSICNIGYDIYYNSSSGNVIDIRGEPWDSVNIYNNYFAHENEPTYNESNSSSREAYKQSNTRDSSWGYLAGPGEFTDNYNTYNNKFDMANTSYEAGYGADVDIASGGAVGHDLTVNAVEEGGERLTNGISGISVTLLRDR